ncbi:MAG: DNA topoisomerase I [Candidatus Woesearchaeota archaeon]|jgi:DNA topoisomerase-1
MTYEVIISEKPSTAKKIAEALADGKPVAKKDGQVSYFELSHGKQDIVVCSVVGHVYGLKQKGDAGWVYPIFDVEWVESSKIGKGNDYTSKYVSLIKKLAKNASEFTVATDYDIEGEVIGLNIIRFACGKKDANRMFYSTTTKEDLVESYEHKKKHLDWPQANAGITRHELDFYYGINLSRALSLSIKHATGAFKVMSSGRVQGPALKIIVDKEREIMKFISTPYWQIILDGELSKFSIEALHEEDKFLDEKKAFAVIEKTKGKNGKIAVIEKRQTKSQPPHPFDLTSLQVESFSVCGISPKETLEIAQDLYVNSFISYPRTSSDQLPDSINFKKILKMLENHSTDVKKLISNVLSFKILKPNNGKKTDPAHPAIYPTGVVPSKLDERAQRVYDLIVHRFIATFCPEATRETVTYRIDVNTEIFVCKGTRTVDPGWQKYYGPFLKLDEVELPMAKEGDAVIVKKIEKLDKMTAPPKRYTPASIIKELEKRNLGTKATRAQIVDNLVQREYVSGKSLAATELGIRTCGVLENYSPQVLDEQMTRDMEDEMDQIREDKIKPQQVLDHAKKILIELLTDFKKKEKEIGKELSDANRVVEDKKNTIGPCPICKVGTLMIKTSKYGFFVACSKYPECKAIFNLPKSKVKPTDKPCEVCTYPVIQIFGGRGKPPRNFCINPKCSTRANGGAGGEENEEEKEKLIALAPNCPKCGKKMSLRKSFYGQFYGCPGYPNCKSIIQIKKDGTGPVDAKKEDVNAVGDGVVIKAPQTEFVSKKEDVKKDLKKEIKKEDKKETDKDSKKEVKKESSKKK